MTESLPNQQFHSFHFKSFSYWKKTLNINGIEVDFKSLSLLAPFFFKWYSVSFFTDINPKIKRHFGSMQGNF